MISSLLTPSWAIDSGLLSGTPDSFSITKTVSPENSENTLGIYIMEKGRQISPMIPLKKGNKKYWFFLLDFCNALTIGHQPFIFQTAKTNLPSQCVRKVLCLQRTAKTRSCQDRQGKVPQNIQLLKQGRTAGFAFNIDQVSSQEI